MSTGKSAPVEPLATAAVAINPFPGLRPFREEEEYLFFGRESQIDAMVDKLAANRFLAVVGTSGSGKSSLVNCGLRPALHGGLMAPAGTAWRMAQFRPGSDPLRAMADALAGDGVLFRDYQAAGLTLAEIVDTTLRMSKLGLVDIVEQAALEEGVNLLVVVDQFEELFRYRQLEAAQHEQASDIAEQASAFVNLLLEATQQTTHPIYVVLTMRSDFLGDCTQFRGLAEAINAGQYLVPRMTREERRAAIVGPASVGGAAIAPVLLTRLVNDVGDNPDQLSILQHALNRTWARWQEEGSGNGPLDLPHYEAIGTMAHALDQHAEGAYAELANARRQQICAKVFKALTDKATDPRGIRRPTTFGTLCALADTSEAEITPVIDVFRDPGRSFLMPPAGEALESQSVIDISHESLMRVWRRLDTWADEESRSAYTYRRLAETAALHAQGQASLWRDPDLSYARQWQAREAPNATWAARYAPGFDDARAFLRASEAAHAAELEQARQRVEVERAAKERELEQANALAQAQRQRADEQAAARIRQRRLSWGLAAILGLAVAAAGYGWQQKTEAERQTKVAENHRRVAERQTNVAERQSKVALSRQLSLLADNELRQGALQRAILLSATGYQFALSKEARLKLEWALADQPQLRTFLSGHHNSVISVAFSPDGNTLASAGDDETVILWDVAGRKPLGEPLAGHRGPVSSVAFSPDGKTLASAADDKTVRLWDVASRKPLGELAGHQEWLNSVAFSPDGKTLASASGDQTVILWDVASRQPLGAPLAGHTGGVSSVTFSPGGKTLASASGDKTVILWDVANRQPLGAPLAGHTDGVSSVAFSPDGKMLASASRDKSVMLWDVESHTRLGEPLTGHQSVVYGVTFSPDGKTLASTSFDKSVILWDVASHKPLSAPLTGHDGQVYGVAFSADGKTLASASEDQTVMLWDAVIRIPSGEPLTGHKAPVTSVAFSPDGKTFASAGEDQTVILWDAARHKPLGAPLTGHQGKVYGVAFSADGKTLASASGDKSVMLWDVASHKPLGDPLTGHESEVYGVAFSADGKTLASASEDKSVMLWDVASRKPSGAPLADHQSAVAGVAFSPDGKTLASASFDNTVMLWDVASRKPLGAPLAGHKDTVYSVAFSPDGKMLAAAGFDKTVTLWDVESRTRLGEPLTGHTHRVWHVAFSRDGKTLASASEDETVILRDVASRRPLSKPLTDHHGAVRSVTFSPDGKTLAAASGDKTVIRWPMNLQYVQVPSPLLEACAIANRNLTHAEWTEYVGEGVVYEALCATLPVLEN